MEYSSDEDEVVISQEEEMCGGQDMCLELEEVAKAMESQLKSLEEANQNEWDQAKQMQAQLIEAEKILKQKSQEVASLQLTLLRERQSGDSVEMSR
jgi:hypothetical protein